MNRGRCTLNSCADFAKQLCQFNEHRGVFNDHRAMHVKQLCQFSVCKVVFNHHRAMIALYPTVNHKSLGRDSETHLKLKDFIGTLLRGKLQ